ncbi:MAG: hypothetical protein IKS98_08475 [Lachnospiraceae bacterium]|nr:hypothetical protein [Lachnospiraceae bacterium]
MGFQELKDDDMFETSGGGLIGAFIGAVFGTGAGLVVGSIAAIVEVVTGHPEEAGDVIDKCASKGLGAGILVGFTAGP